MPMRRLSTLILTLVLAAGSPTVALAQPSGGSGPAAEACVFQPTSAADRSASGAPQLFVGAAKSSLWRHQEKDYSQYLRFYGDGGVIGVSSTGTPAEVIRWLKAPYEDTGAWTLTGRRLSFNLTSSVGRVDYDGLVEGERLHLLSCSRINGNRSTDVYSRVAGF